MQHKFMNIMNTKDIKGKEKNGWGRKKGKRETKGLGKEGG